MQQAPAYQYHFDTVTLDDIDIHNHPDIKDDAERGILIGGTRVGKSTTCELLINRWVKRYRARKPRTLVLDTKPHFQAEWLLDGRSAARLYKRKGRRHVLPNSYLIEPRRYGSIGHTLKDVWTLGGEIAILQSDLLSDRPTMLIVLDEFFRDSRLSQPHLVVVDEVLDFFNRTGWVIKGADSDTILRVVRSGGEVGCAFLGNTQRPSGLPIQLVSELSKAYVFRLDYVPDVEKLYNMGLPMDAPMPSERHVFLFYDKIERKIAMVRLKLTA